MAAHESSLVLVVALIALVGTFLSSLVQLAIAIDTRSSARNLKLLELEHPRVAALAASCMKIRQQVFDPDHWPGDSDGQQSLSKQLAELQWEVYPLVGYPKAAKGLYEFLEGASYVWKIYLASGLDKNLAISAETIRQADRSHTGLIDFVIGSREMLTESKFKRSRRLKKADSAWLPPNRQF